MFEIKPGNQESMWAETQKHFAKMDNIDELWHIQSYLFHTEEKWVCFGDSQITGISYPPDHNSLTVTIQYPYKKANHEKYISNVYYILTFFDPELEYMGIEFNTHWIDDVCIQQNDDGKYSITFGNGELDFRYSHAKVDRTWIEYGIDPVSVKTPIKVSVDTDLLCYGPCPEPSDVIFQRLTINRRGQVWFTTRTMVERNTPQVGKKPLYRQIHPEAAENILRMLYAYFTGKPNLIYLTDGGSWEMTLTIDDRQIIKESSSLGNDKFLIQISDLIRKELPGIDAEVFGVCTG